MISEANFKLIQEKAKDFLSSVAKKVWENKFVVIPIAIFGYGLVKNKVSLKSRLAKSQKHKERNEEDSKVHRNSKVRIHLPNINLQVKPSHIVFKEDGLINEDLSTACHSDKENVVLATPVIDKLNTDAGMFSGYPSDVESIAQEKEKRDKKKNELKKPSNPDDLFFTIFQKLN